MNFDLKLQDLRDRIKQTLTPLVDNNYILVDLPYHHNIGDSLIWQGEEDFLSGLPYKCLYRCYFATYNPERIKKILRPETIVLCNGGGNFGDVWPFYQDFRRKIVLQFPNNKIIFFPQTVYYEHLGHLSLDKQVFSSHKDLTICARDQYSYNLLSANHVAKSVLLVPDMAFCIDDARLEKLRVPVSKERLLLKRTDKEFSSSLSNIVSRIQTNAEVHDWPTMEGEDKQWQWIVDAIWGKNKKTAIEIDEFAINQLLPHNLEVGVRFVSQYKEVFTTRLHVSILSVLLRKSVMIIDNSYGKNSQFYDTWLADTEGVELIGRRNYTIKDKIVNYLSCKVCFIYFCRILLSVQCRWRNFFEQR